MTFFPIFLSVVVVVRNNANQPQPLLEEAGRLIAASVSEYELIVVDNASEDDSLRVLKKLTGPDGLPNLQVYGLTKEVDMDAAFWVGFENALGDFCAVLDPLVDDTKFLQSMFEKISDGTDQVRRGAGVGHLVAPTIVHVLPDLAGADGVGRIHLAPLHWHERRPALSRGPGVHQRRDHAQAKAQHRGGGVMNGRPGALRGLRP
jgi:hypothetical protein